MNVNCGRVIFLMIAVASAACADHDIPKTFDCSTEAISYLDDVKPIVAQNCAISGCHNGDLGSDKDWRDFQKLQARAGEMKRRVTLPEGAAGHMAARGSLTFDEIQTLVCWVDQGALDN